MKNLIEALRTFCKLPMDELVSRYEVLDLFKLFLHHFGDSNEILKAIEELDKEEKENEKI